MNSVDQTRIKLERMKEGHLVMARELQTVINTLYPDPAKPLTKRMLREIRIREAADKVIRRRHKKAKTV